MSILANILIRVLLCTKYLCLRLPVLVLLFLRLLVLVLLLSLCLVYDFKF